MKRLPQYTAGVIFAICLMITLLITSVEAVVYWLPGYFEKEYAKYNVTEVVDMTMEDLLDVTDEMMAYLRGKRADLHVDTTMGGVQREFFNEREIAHMEDVRGLFLDALMIRRGCLLIMALCLISLFLLKADFKTVFPRAVSMGSGLFFAASAVLAGIISTDFSKYFIMFHHIFFSNDLWILNPETDMLINIVPEGFFSDTVVHIGVIFFLCVLITFGICFFSIWKHRKKAVKQISAFFLCLILFTGGFSGTAAAAPEWPSNVSVQAESGIVIDAATGTVLWGQNIHNQYFPASITKIMTALLVIEKCELDEVVTFSHNAVYNVESGSSNAGINEGDQLSVKDCLYALLLKSANEAANALAEHVSGTTEDFAELMNERARELGCTDTHFANPSGLNNPEHYTSAYDMALIARAAFSNPTFEEIDSTTYYKLPPNSINPEGLTIYPGHKMLKKSTPYYYPGIVGGKTGYTMLAGNTLVTCAEKNGMRLIAVILKGTTPQYWTDTKNLLDFGFSNFVSVKASEHETLYTSVTSDLSFGGLSIDRPEALILDPENTIILPKTADFSDADAMLSYDISPGDPPEAIAKIYYRYNERQIGCTYLEINKELFGTGGNAAGGMDADGISAGGLAKSVQDPDSPQGSGSAQPDDTGAAGGAGVSGGAGATGESGAAVGAGEPGVSGAAGAAGESGVSGGASESGAPGSDGESTEPEETEDYRAKALRPFEIPAIAWIILISVASILVIGCGVAFFLYTRGQERHNTMIRREQRRQRLQDSGISVEEFNALVEQRRSASSSRKKKGRGNRHLKFK